MPGACINRRYPATLRTAAPSTTWVCCCTCTSQSEIRLFTASYISSACGCATAFLIAQTVSTPMTFYPLWMQTRACVLLRCHFACLRPLLRPLPPRYERARELFERALRSDPSHTSALHNLAFLLDDGFNDLKVLIRV